MYKIGDKGKIVANKHAHGFDIGDIVTIVFINKTSYGAKSERDFWWVTEDEIELIEEKPMFDINKPFTTRDGRDVRVLCTDGPGSYPVVGFVGDGSGVTRWKLNGENEDHRLTVVFDLINTPPKPIDLGWVTIYVREDDESEGWVEGSYETKQNAENASYAVCRQAFRHLSFVNGKIVDDTEEVDNA